MWELYHWWRTIYDAKTISHNMTRLTPFIIHKIYIYQKGWSTVTTANSNPMLHTEQIVNDDAISSYIRKISWILLFYRCAHILFLVHKIHPTRMLHTLFVYFFIIFFLFYFIFFRWGTFQVLYCDVENYFIFGFHIFMHLWYEFEHPDNGLV